MNDIFIGKSSQQRLSPTFKIFRLMKMTLLIAVSIIMVGAVAGIAAPLEEQANSPIVAKCKADLAKRLNQDLQYIKVINVQTTTWNDSSLGMPEIGKMYAQMMTPGLKVILEAKSSQYLYTTSTKSYKYGGPIAILAYSMLYTKPVENEPNLNSDLYQCSLLGTNSNRLISGVSDYYPQKNGIVIVKKRTSRSSHELLYVKADGSGTTKTLQAAFDFGEAALNDAQNEWAGFVKPSVGKGWEVVIAPTDEAKTQVQTLSLPVGVRPEHIVWSGEKLMIMTKNAENIVYFEISPKTDKAQWKPIGSHLYPGLTDYMLNKSETLEINQIKENNKPVVEVVRVWFTGDRNVKARIEDFTLRGYDLLGVQLALVWGEKDSKPAAFTIDIRTGEVILCSSGISQDIKPFLCPPLRSPIDLAKAN